MTMPRTIIFVALFLLASIWIGVVCTADDSFRHWTTTNGIRSSVKLKVVELTDSVVTLERENDRKIVRIAIAKLSKVDRQFLETWNDDSISVAMTSAVSVDWPQWRGKLRDGKSPQIALADSWPNSGPSVLWNVTGLGEGYSTPSVAGDSIYVLGTKGNSEKLFCLRIRDGQTQWSADVGTKAGGGGYPGPRGTPTVDGDAVYAIGSDGTLACIDRQSGQPRWKRNMKSDFGGQVGNWDYAESPLIDGKRLICTPGGTKATVVALDKARGTPIWTGSAAELGNDYCRAAYSSPIAAEIGGVRQYVVFLHGGVVGFDATSGKGLWHYDAPANSTANCSTPVVHDNHVFAASGYGTGGGKARVTGRGRNWSVQEQFFVKKFENHHGGFVFHENHIYGTNNSVLMCLDWDTGNVRWQDRSVGKGSVSFADGHLYVRGERGEVALVEAVPDAYREKGRFMQPDRSDKNAWPHSVISDGKLLLRDQDRLLCFEIAK